MEDINEMRRRWKEEETAQKQNRLNEEVSKSYISSDNGHYENEVLKKSRVNNASYNTSSFNHEDPMFAKVKAIIADKLGIEECEVVENAYLKNDLGADSLDSVELIMEFEKEFGISIPDDQAEKISTVGDAIAYIEANAK